MPRHYREKSVVLKSAAFGMVLGLGFMNAAHAQNLGSFSAADVQRDGCVTLPEFSAYETMRLMAAHGFIPRMFQQMTPQEQAAHLQARFEKLDTSHKGCLDQSEWAGS
jgi:Ca2+-binding EF-hand superfamily protein